MAPGKAASQAVHAARLSLLRYLTQHPERAEEFIAGNSCGSVVVLVAKSLRHIEEAQARALADGLPAALFVDSGHIPIVWLPPGASGGDATASANGGGLDESAPFRGLTAGGARKATNPHFDGSPVPTALAIGPAPREAMRGITRRFRCA